MALKKIFMSLFGVQFALVFALGGCSILLFLNQRDLDKSRDVHTSSYLLADELRQSSDDLTRLARTYVATGNAEFEREYWAVLDIRNGKSPRPQNYNRIYWDLVAAIGQKPRPDGRTVSLHELMVKAGFTDAEFMKLKEAQSNSNELVSTERIAMNAVKGLFDDGSGNFAVVRNPDREMAIRIMNDEAYHRSKANIMRPIDDFFGMFMERTERDVATHQRRSAQLLWGLLSLISVVLGMFWYSFITIKRQINKRQQAEEALRESEYFFRESQHAAFMGSYKADFITDCWKSSEVLDQVFGIDKSYNRNVQSWLEIIHPDDREMMERYLREEVISKRKPFDKEYRIRRQSDGEIRWVIGLGEVGFDIEGNVISMIGTIQDITEHKLAEIELLKFKFGLERSGEAIFLTDVEGRIVYANPAFEKTYGYSPKEILGNTPRILKSGLLSGEAYKSFWDALLSKHVVSGEIANKTKDGRILTIENSANPVLDAHGNVIAFLAIQRDITERKRAENALRDSEEKYRVIFETAANLIISVDANGILVDCNGRSEAILDYNKAELIGRNMGDIIHSDYHSKARESLAEIMTTGAARDKEYKMIRKDGRIIDVNINSSALTDNKGNFSRTVCIIEDITETKRLQALASRAERLETAGKIAGQVAHDFNNLLGPMIAYPEMIREELPAGHPVLSYIDDIENAAQQIADINQQLLTLGRRGHYNQEIINLNNILRQAARDMGQLPNTLVCNMDLAENLFNIRAGGAQLHRVFSNLLNNARDAMRDIGLITIKTENYYVDDISVIYGQVPKGEYVKLTISDTGCGIPNDIIQKIFDPFFTTKTADKRRGSGLGMSVVDAVIKDHNGYIDLKTKVGEGTSFYIYFPICREATGNPDMDIVSGGNEKILVIDDDDLQREVSGQLLTKLGYKVTSVESGEKAIQILRSNSHDLLVIDMIMTPGIDGTDTYRRVIEINPSQRAIIVSGFAESDRVFEAQKLGVGAFVKKPLTRNTLAAAVRTELDRKAKTPVS